MVGRSMLAVVLTGVVVASTAAASVSVSSSRRAAYAGLGTWLDIYAKKAWRDPGREVAAMAREGVRTLYLQTGNYKQGVDLVRPRAVGRFIEGAHTSGMRVVAWYLPSFANPGQDRRRALAAIRFLSPSGERFDGFALDIEATVVRRMRLRNRRLLQLSRQLRSAVGPAYPLGAITPSPVGMSPSYWPNIPYRVLSHFYDTFLPMAYSTDRGVTGSRATFSYLSATIAAIRTRAGNPRLPIHLIGGLSGEMGARETAGFMRAVTNCATLGYSLYAFPTTRRDAWQALTNPPAAPVADDPLCG
jgi:hypothetical protein